MLKVDYTYKMSQPDSLAVLRVYKYLFRDREYAIFEGLKVTKTGDMTVQISPGKAIIVSELCFIRNTDVVDVDLTEIVSEPTKPLLDGYHPLVISYKPNTKQLFLSLIMELEPGKWDNPITSHHVVLGIVQIVGGVIYSILDEHDKWLRVEIGGGGGGVVAVKDENTVITNAAAILNFLGSDVVAKMDTLIPDQVNIYIPPPTYVSHFNTTDGINDATVPAQPTYNRYVSKPTTEGNPYKIGDWTPGSLHPVINNGTLIYQPNGNFSCASNNTVFEVRVMDADGITELSSITTTIDSNRTETATGITLDITNFGPDTDKYQANVTVTINLDQLIPHGGRFSIHLLHNDGAEGTFTFAQNNLFYDTNENEATINGDVIISEGNTIQTLYLSGVQYYTLGTYFRIQVLDIDWLNDRSYPDIQVQIDPTILAIPMLNLQGSDLSDWENIWNNIDVYYDKENVVSIHNYCFIGDSYANARTNDWSYSSWKQSNLLPVCINTYDDNSTRIYEDFVNENQRLTSSFTSWDSTQNLLSYDDNLGLQVRCSRLVYPTENFQTYNPNPSSQPDYTSATGERYFLRRIWHTGVSHSNGRFRFSDFNITEDNITNHDIEIWISLNGTDWFCCNDDYPGGTISNGDGCRVSPDQYNLDSNQQIAFTLGTGKFTDSSTAGGWGLYVKIIYKDNPVGRNAYIGSIAEVTWV